MTSATVIRLFDIAIIRFVFEDKPNVSKPRPAVVVGIDASYLTVALAKITGHAPRPEYPGEVELADWQSEGLLLPSTVRCSKVVRVPVSEVTRIIGSLTDRDVLSVLEGLEEAGQAFEQGQR